MRATIDKAGRVVIPWPLRERAGLLPGAVLQVTVDDTGIRIERVAPRPAIMSLNGRLVARPSTRRPLPKIDIAALVEEERGR